MAMIIVSWLLGFADADDDYSQDVSMLDSSIYGELCSCTVWLILPEPTPRISIEHVGSTSGPSVSSCELLTKIKQRPER